MSCTICWPSLPTSRFVSSLQLFVLLFRILCRFQGLPGFPGAPAAWLQFAFRPNSWWSRPGYTLRIFQMQRDVHGASSAWSFALSMCPCRCSTQISGLCIVVFLGSRFSDVNQIVCWLSLRLVCCSCCTPNTPSISPPLSLLVCSAYLVGVPLISYDLVCA